jgi:hypothetical protein
MTRKNQSDVPKAHPCTFRRCKHSYVTLRNLKQHLCDVRGGGYDNGHPMTDPEWKRLDDSDFLKVHRRPGDLPQEERDRRRALTQKQHYERHKGSILQRSKERRARINDTLEVANKLGELTKSIRSRVQGRSRLLQSLYGTSTNYKLDTFVNITAKPTLDTFPRLVSFFLPQNTIPDITGAVPGVTRILDVIPGPSHFRKVSALLHPDKNPDDTNTQKVLNAAFDLWRPILENPEIVDELVVAHDDESTTAFCSKGDDYAALSQMYFSYMLAVNNAVEVLSPSTLSISGLQKALLSAEDEEKLLLAKDGGAAEDPIENMIEKALKVTTGQQKRNKGGVGQKEMRAVEGEEEDEEGEEEEEEEEEENPLLDPGLFVSGRTRKSKRARK